MPQTSYTELTDSQLPALQFLQKLGYTYMSPEETVRQRGEILSNVLLEEVLLEQLHNLNQFEYKGKTYNFSEGNLQEALNALKNVPDGGLQATNEKVYDLLTLGKSQAETIQGDHKSFSIRYIDWENPENNVYHVTDEFEVTGLYETRRPDLVLFVNGIPFVVMENKRRDKQESLQEAISQHLRNQTKEEGTPRLFHYGQMLVALHPNEAKFATVDTPEKFWNLWREDGIEEEVQKLIQSSTQEISGEDRLPTEQDRVLYCLCRPERLMELSYKFIVFDGGQKKITRYQQYFAVQNTLERIKENDNEGNRKGGVIWHTQGSGKSLTMVMLSKCLTLDPDIENPRVVLVTDRVDLDEQIWKTFYNCGKQPRQANSGKDLIDLLKAGHAEIITTVIDKFESGLNRQKYQDPDSNIFVLVDESHRSQYGDTHAKMKKVMPNACFIGFTGTPLMKKEKSTARKFGGFIDRYTIDQAVKDGAVLPLLYEGRSAKVDVNKEQLDKGFNRLAEPLNEYQTRDLKKQYASIARVFRSQQVIEEIAEDISRHYVGNWQGSGLKAQLAVPDKLSAIKYHRYFQQQSNPDLQINTAVVISPPDKREGYYDVHDENQEEVQQFWQNSIEKYGSQENYEEKIIDQFKSDSDDVEILIVVNKLLTGFDAPRNTILYLAKPLSDHNLLQAIARVNRLFEGKDHGYVLDYIGLLGNLDKALTQYSALEEFEEEDLKGAVHNVDEIVKEVPYKYSAVWDLFKEVENKQDQEALERHLSPEDRRQEFYQRLSDFAKSLQAALSTDAFHKEFSEEKIKHFKYELKFFNNLRQSVQNRYAEKINFKEYEKRIKKLLDTHVHVKDVENITQPIDIFDDDLFKEEVERVTGNPASKADTIAHKMKKTINEKMDEDPVFYKQFSDLIEQAIQDFEEGRISEAEYLKRVVKHRNEFVSGQSQDIPGNLQNKPQARAFYGALKDVFKRTKGSEQLPSEENGLAQVGEDIENIIQKLTIRDWKRNTDIQKEMKNQVEDYLLEKQQDLNLKITFEEIDEIFDFVLKIARSNY